MTVAGQSPVNYRYDPSSRLTEINSIINGVAADFSFDYDALGRRTSLGYPNGVVTTYNHDNTGNLLTLEYLNPLNQILESISYTYDENRNRTSMQRANTPVKLPDPKANITFNSANHMLTFDGKSMTYDENGNLTSVIDSCGTTTYTWDARNRLVAINGFNSALSSTSTCEVLSASFKHDAFGRRIQKTINGRIVGNIYDRQDIVQEIEDGTATANYLRALDIDEVLARLTPSTSRFYQMDAVGSVIALVDENGVTATTYTYDAFGNVSISGESGDNPFQYTGRENDGSGLYHYRARYYAPVLQRFLSEDPIGLNGGDVNLYSYVKNNPIKLIDPLGLYCVYSQSTGRMTCYDDRTDERYYDETGYSGRDDGSKKGRNNPDMQDVKDIGPIPRGLWYWGSPIGGGYNPLVPAPGNTCFDTRRNCYTFFSHRDNSAHTYSASKGCIVLSDKRRRIPPGEKIYVVP